MKLQTAVALALIASGLMHRRCGSMRAVVLPSAGALIGLIALFEYATGRV